MFAIKASEERMLSHSTLKKNIAEIAGCGQTTAYKVIEEAKEKGLIKKIGNGMYAATDLAQKT